MAEPMSAGEIEDVLASIRRLVSQDGRARPDAVDTAPPVPQPAAGKLILTPALRVVEPTGAPQPQPQPSAPPGPETAADLWPDNEARDEAAAPPSPPAAAVAAAIARLVPDWDDDVGAAPAASRLSWIEVADSLEDEPDEAPRFVHRSATAPPPEPRDEQPALIGTAEEVLDEGVLREIVREVLREELQGHLGERMTRSIRKLVRAEVHRSLTLRDFD